MAKKELFKFKPFGALIRKLGAFPVDRGGGGKGIAAIKNSVSIIEDGRIVGIFPQGTRKKHVFPGDTKIHSGVGMIQAKTGCPVIPVSIQTKNYRVIPFFRKIYLTIGKPMRNEDFADLDDREDRYKLISDRIFGKIVSQLKQ